MFVLIAIFRVRDGLDGGQNKWTYQLIKHNFGIEALVRQT